MNNLDLTGLFGSVFDFLFLATPFLLPIILGAFVIKLWVDLARRAFLDKQKYKLLRIIPPLEVTKTPAAMEIFLITLHQTFGETTWIDRYVKGQTRPWFSLELASINGDVRFYIWGREGAAKQVEAQLYAQYPGIEVEEAEDYSRIEFDDTKLDLAAIEFKLGQPDPYPIKTYVDYGLDKESEEEYKSDPITAMLELLGSIGPGHQIWIQILIKAHKKEDKDPAKIFGKVDAWKETAKSEIKRIREESIVEKGVGDKKTAVQNRTKGQDLIIAALERSISKISFDTGIRFIYLAEKDIFNMGYFGATIGAFKQYSSLDLNGFDIAKKTKFDYPWQDFTGKKEKKLKREMLEAYKTRGYFWRDFPGLGFLSLSKKRVVFVLNTEELATIYHFPGLVAQTPTMTRIYSKKSAPPSNLPI